MQDILAIIMGGGRGERLYPLTKLRAKPALPLAGKYRLIDIPISNCINSEVRRIYVLTQFNSASLNRHIANTYRFYPFMKGFVEILAAQQTPISPDWFQGTADAVRKSLWVMESQPCRDYLILSGDHLYRMDYRRFVARHRETDADATIAVTPVDAAQATGYGLIKTDAGGGVIEFREKPTGTALEQMRVDMSGFAADRVAAERTPFLASMGIYVFRRDVLRDLLKTEPGSTDFGKHIIPASITRYNVQSFVFRDYWEDIGTIETFYKANMALTRQPDPQFSFFDEEFPIYTRARFLPPSKVLQSHIEMAMIADGCIIHSSRVVKSVIGIRSRLAENSDLENVLLMGADFYQSDANRVTDTAAGIPHIGIGKNSVIRNAIIDKNVRIGCNVQITNTKGIQTADHEDEGYCIRNGIVIIIKGAVIHDNTVL